MQADDPPFLTVGTDVSAKYKGAFCEAKIKKVVKNIKCRVTLKVGGAITVNDEAIVKGNLRIGNTVQVKQDPKKDSVEAVLNKIQDCSQYTVVFDDGDITTLRRSALCLKSGRHFNESETLDQLPLTHPEHFSTPVIAGRRGRRGRAQSEDSEGDAPVRPRKTDSTEQEPHVGRVVLVDNTSGTERRRPQPPAFPALVVAPTTQINVKDDYIVRSFKDGRYYTVPKKETREFRKGSAPSDWAGVDAALQYMNNGVLPPHWDRDTLFNEPRNTSDDVSSSSDDEPREEKDHFVAQLYKFMDDRGTPLNRNPTIANRDIDLYRLFRVVQKLGGYNRVTNQNQWKSIADKMGFHPVNTSITNLCKQAYKKFLHSFEDFYRKLGVTLVAHPRGARTPPAGRSLIRDRDKQLPSSTTPTPPNQRVKSDKDSDKSEADKSEKEDGKPEPKVEKEVKEKEKVKEKDKEKEKEKSRSDEDDSADNEPLSVVPKIEKEKEKEKEKDRERDRDKDKEKEKEKEKPTEEKEKIKTQKTRIPISSRMVKETQEKRTPKPRRSLSTREKGDSNGTSTSTSRVSSRPQVSTDSDSSGRASRNNFRCGLNKKMQSRRSQSANSASSGNTVASNSSKRARKRKTTEPSQEEHVLLRGPGNIKASVGDKLQVYYGPAQPESKVTYEAKVIEISAEGLLRVHYTGWNTRYDEWIKPQRIALNVTEHERSGKKVIIGGRRVRPKRAEGSPARSDSSDSDSEIERKRTPPSEPDDKNKPEPCTSKGRRLSSAPIRLKELKSEITPNKIRKRATRNSTSAALTPIPKRRRSSLTHSGRDYDLIEIRSELKGLHSVKQETDDNLKTEVIEKDVSITDLPEQKHDDKQAEDVYEFKEPEPFELELHDEKKKRTHRIFDDISPSKYTSTLTKSLSEEISEDLRTRPLRSPSLSPFRDYPLTGRHSPDDDLKDAVFSMDDDSFPGDGLSGPVFEGFTPAKHQETYSKKRKISKLIDDSPDSPADDEHSSDEEADDIKLKDAREKERSPVKAIKDVSKSPERSRKELHLEMYKEHNMETKEEENKELEEAPPPAVIVEKIEETKLVAIPSAIALPPIDSKIEDMDTSTDLNTPDSPQMDTEEDKSEPDSPARSDIIPDPPPGFLLHSEGPKIVDKLLQAIAKQQSKSPPPAEELPDTPEIDPSPEITKLEAKIPPKIEIVKELDTTSKSSIFDEPPILSDTMSDIRKVKSPSRLLSPLNVLERRKSLVDMPLCSGAKSNKVLSDTIQKLSSQINQPVSNITLPAFPPEDRSSSSDSDDSDRRLIIDKLSVDEWGSSGGSSEGPVAPARAVSGVHATKSPGEWSVGETLLMLEDACKNERKHSANVVVAGNMRSRTVSGVSAAEEDSNLSLLLCEETIPGSPAPDTEPTPQRLRPHMPFASAPSHHNTEERRTESSILGMGSGVSGLNSSDNGRRIPTRETSAWGRSIEQSPSTTPDSGSDMSPHRDNRRSRDSPPERKDDEEDSRPHEPIAMDLEKTIGGIRSRKASESSGAGMSVPVSAGRGRPRRCRRDTDEPPLMPPIPVPGPTLKYNFYVELDARWDSQSRINLITSKLSDLRKAYHDVKAELAAIDRRRKKLRRKEREAIKAAKAACS